MAEISMQGTLSAGSTTIYTCPAGQAKISSIKFNNTSAYTLSLLRYDDILNNTITVYTFNLSAGDFVIDNNLYLMKENDYLSVNISVAGTDYLIYLIEF